MLALGVPLPEARSPKKGHCNARNDGERKRYCDRGLPLAAGSSTPNNEYLLNKFSGCFRSAFWQHHGERRAAVSNTKITPETEVSATELACVLGITARYIRQLAEDGKLEKVSKGRFLLCESVQRYVKSQSKEDARSVEEQRLEKARQAADVTLKSSKAKIAKLEADELQGKMHRSEDVAALTEDLIYTIRSSLMALPGRLAVDVAAAATPAEAAEIIRKEVHALMRELANYKYDPEKYEERVRERRNWEAGGGDVDDE